MSEYNSREIPSGFLVDGPAVFLGCVPEEVDGPGMARILRTSAALAAIVDENVVGGRKGRWLTW